MLIPCESTLKRGAPELHTSCCCGYSRVLETSCGKYRSHKKSGPSLTAFALCVHFVKQGWEICVIVVAS